MPGKVARNVNPPWQYACRQGGLAISQDARRPNRVDVGEAFARPIFDHWLSVTLVGRKSNRAGIGAEVIARTAGLTQHRFCHTDGSYLSASDRRVLIGLGKATQADLTVRRPSGRTTTLRNVAADR